MVDTLLNLSGANNSTSLKMTSREIAEITGKQHGHVLRDCDKLNENYEKLQLSKIGETFSIRQLPNGGQTKDKFYELTKLQTMDLMTGYNIELRIKVIRRWEELENSLNGNQNVISLPQNYEEALEHLLIQVRENKKLIAENKEMQPKADFYDAVVQSEDTIDVGQVAKVLAIKGYGRNNLFKLLREQKVLMHNNQPYQKYIDCGYFKQIETQWYDRKAEITHIGLKTVVYQKGLDFIRNLIEKQK